MLQSPFMSDTQQLQHQDIDSSFELEHNDTRATAAGQRPKMSLASLIGQAIMASNQQKARLSTIYEWISERYPDYYRMNSGGWQVSLSAFLLLVSYLEFNQA